MSCQTRPVMWVCFCGPALKFDIHRKNVKENIAASVCSCGGQFYIINILRGLGMSLLEYVATLQET